MRLGEIDLTGEEYKNYSYYGFDDIFLIKFSDTEITIDSREFDKLKEDIIKQNGLAKVEFRVDTPRLTALFDDLSEYIYSLNYEIEGLEEELTKDMTNLESRELKGHLKNVKAERESLTRLLERYK